MFYLVNHDMPEEIIFDDELTNNQEYSKMWCFETILQKFKK